MIEANFMSIYDRIIENPLFFKWIFHPSPEINAWWDHYLENNPAHAEKITEFKTQIEIHLKYREEKLSEAEKKELARRIIRMLERTDRKQNRIRLVRSVMRYAAVSFLFLLVGGSLVYLYMERRQPQIVYRDVELPAQVQEPLLILGDRGRLSSTGANRNWNTFSGGNPAQPGADYTGDGENAVPHNEHPGYPVREPFQYYPGRRH